MANTFILSPSIGRIGTVAASVLITLGVGIFLHIKCGSNNNSICQQWSTSDGRQAAYVTSSGSLVAKTLSGATYPAFRGIELYASGSTVTTGSGKGMIPPLNLAAYSGSYLNSVSVYVQKAGVTGSTCFQLRDLDKGSRKLLSTPVCVDSATTDSNSAGTPFVVNSSNKDVGPRDRIAIDVTSVSTTSPQEVQIINKYVHP